MLFVSAPIVYAVEANDGPRPCESYDACPNPAQFVIRAPLPDDREAEISSHCDDHLGAGLLAFVESDIIDARP